MATKNVQDGENEYRSSHRGADWAIEFPALAQSDRGCRLTPRQRMEVAARLPAFQVCIDLIQVIGVLSGVRIPRRVNLLEHSIFPRFLLR